MLYDVDIQFKHETPIPTTIILDVIATMEKRVQSLRWEQLETLKNTVSQDAQDLIDRIQQNVLLQPHKAIWVNWLWVEYTYSGSSNYKGKGGGFKTFLLSAITFLGADVIEQTEPYQEIRDAIVEEVNEEYTRIIQACQNDYEGFFVRCYSENDRLKLEITIDENITTKYQIIKNKLDKSDDE